MRKYKKLIQIMILFTVAVLCAVIPFSVYAWITKTRTKLILIVGDVEISVNGWYNKVNADAEIIDYKFALKDTDDGGNLINNMAAYEMIAFKFELINNKERDAVVSISFNDLSDFIYDNFSDFRKEKQLGGSEISSALAADIDESAKSNTAKLVFIFDYMYYQIEGEEEKTDINLTDKFLWKYATGDPFIQNIPLPAKVDDTVTKVNIYFSLKNSQSNLSIEGYRNSICGHVEDVVEDETITQITHIGIGQERCAKKLGYYWNALPANEKAIVDEYLKYYVDQELASIRIDEFGDSKLALTIKNFIFIGENTSETN